MFQLCIGEARITHQQDHIGAFTHQGDAQIACIPPDFRGGNQQDPHVVKGRDVPNGFHAGEKDTLMRNPHPLARKNVREIARQMCRIVRDNRDTISMLRDQFPGEGKHPIVKRDTAVPIQQDALGSAEHPTFLPAQCCWLLIRQVPLPSRFRLR